MLNQLFGANVPLPPNRGNPSASFIADRRWVRGNPAHPLDDEFNDGLISQSWMRVDNVGSRAVWTEAGDSLSLYLTGGDAAAETHAILKSFAMPIGNTIQCHLKGLGELSTYPQAGLIIADGMTYGSGVQAFHSYYLTSGATNWDMVTTTYSGFNSRTSFTEHVSSYFGLDLHMRLEYSASNQFKYYVSPDGISWRLLDTRSITMTPTYVGFAGGTYGGSTPFIFSFDYFRVNAP